MCMFFPKIACLQSNHTLQIHTISPPCKIVMLIRGSRLFLFSFCSLRHFRDLEETHVSRFLSRNDS